VKAAQALAQWLGGVKTGQSALAEAERKLAAHVANPPKSADSAEHRAWLATRRQLEDDVEAERGALAIAEAKAAEAKAAAAEEEADAEERRIRKLNDELAKLTVEIGGDAERLAAKLVRHTQMLAEIEAWNANRGGRVLVVDGEKRVREVPEKVFATIYEEMDVWRDASGRKPSVFRQLPSGELVPTEGGYTKHREKFVSRNEWTRPAEIPGGRFKDSCRLIGLKGEALFPAR
jgi:hypothetical protein